MNINNDELIKLIQSSIHEVSNFINFSTVYVYWLNLPIFIELNGRDLPEGDMRAWEATTAKIAEMPKGTRYIVTVANVASMIAMNWITEQTIHLFLLNIYYLKT